MNKGNAAGGNDKVWMHSRVFGLIKAPSIMSQGARVWLPKMV